METVSNLHNELVQMDDRTWRGMYIRIGNCGVEGENHVCLERLWDIKEETLYFSFCQSIKCEL